MSEEVSLELLADLRITHIFCKSRHGETGIVHQHVNARVVLDDLLDGGKKCSLVGDIEPSYIDGILEPGGAYRLIEAPAAGSVTHGGDDAVAAFGQFDCGKE